MKVADKIKLIHGNGTATEYVRADLLETLQARLDAVDKQIKEWLELVNSGDISIVESLGLIKCIGRLSNILKQEQHNEHKTNG